MDVMKADMTIDCCGLLCPFPVVETSKAIKQIEVGQVLKMVATDPGSVPDMSAWSRQTGHTLLDSTQDSDRYIFYFQRVK